MKTRRTQLLFLTSLWAAIVFSFGLFGWFSDEAYNRGGPFYTDTRFEPAVGFAAIGVGVGFCIVMGVIFVGKVRARQWQRGWAAVLLVLPTLAGILLPGFLVSILMRTTRYTGGDYDAEIHLFQGEHGWWLVIAPYYAFWILLCAFFVLLLTIITIPIKPGYRIQQRD